MQGNVERRRFAEQNFLNNNRMQDIEKLARELLSDLASLGLLVGNTAQALSGTGVDNKNSDKPKLVAAALCAGMYPNISRILRPPKRFEEVMGGAFEKEVDGKEIKFYIPDTAVDVPNSEEEEGDDDWSAAENDEKEQDRVPRKLIGTESRGGGRRRTYSSDGFSDDPGEDEGDSATKMKKPRDEIDMEGLFRVFIHPSSVNFSNTQFGKSRYLLYGDIGISSSPGCHRKLSYVILQKLQFILYCSLVVSSRLNSSKALSPSTAGSNSRRPARWWLWCRHSGEPLMPSSPKRSKTQI